MKSRTGLGPQELARIIDEGIKAHGHVDIDYYTFRDVFDQVERKTPFGDAVMNLAGLPTPIENWNRMLRANGWVEIATNRPDVKRVIAAGPIAQERRSVEQDRRLNGLTYYEDVIGS